MGGLGLLVLAVLVGLIGCDGGGDQGEAAANDEPTEPLRIVSFAPALTRAVVDLGLGEKIVGVAEHDVAAPEGTPVVGHFMEVNSERLLAENPTHVLVQATSQGVPETIARLAPQAGYEIVAYPYPDSVAETMAMLGCKPGAFAWSDGAGAVAVTAEGERSPPLGEVLGVPGRGKQLCGRVSEMLNRLRETAMRERDAAMGEEGEGGDGADGPRVLMVFGTEPVMASGPGTVLNDVLVNVLGATNAVEQMSVSAPTLDREALIAAKPDVVLLLMPGAPPLQSLDEDPRVAPFLGLGLPAAENGRIVLLNDPEILLPSTQLDTAALWMGVAVYPGLAARLEAEARAMDGQ